MAAYELYHKAIMGLLNEIAEKEGDKIKAAGRLIAEAIASDKLVYVYGTGGHSYMAAEEMFYRTGGLVPVNAIFDPGVSLSFGATRSTFVERLPGYAKGILEYYKVGEGDVLIVANAYGINSVTIDAAIEAKKRGAKVIAITSPTFARFVPKDHPARHPSKKSLFELKEVDVVIDNHMPIGDAVVELEGLGGAKVGPSSTMVNAFTINCVVVSAVEALLERGITPPVWISSNMPGGDEANRRHIQKYSQRLKHL